MSSSTSSLPVKSQPKILLYGATSYTAKNLLDLLVTHPDRALFSVLLGGRTKAKLDALKVEKNLSNEVVVFSLEDNAVVQKSLKECGCGAVINMAGPYSTQNGESLIKACATLGIHYLDLTAETPWVAAMVKKYDFLASKTNACIIPSSGFDSIPSDLTTFLSAKHLAASSSSNDANITKSQSFFNVRGGISGGTIGSMFAIAEMDQEYKKGALGEFALCRSNGVKSIPQSLYVYNPHLNWTGSFWFMSPANNTVVRRSWDLFLTPPPLSISTSSAAAPVSYGKEFTYSEHLSVAKRGTSVGWLKAWVGGWVTVLGLGIFFGSRVVRGLVKGWLPKAGDGPDVKTLKKGWFDVMNICETDDEPPRRVVTTMSAVGDPGYYSTAVMILESALSLLLSHSSLPALGQQGGVLTPATALGDVLVQRLVRTGEVEFETVGLEEWRESRKTR